MASEKITGILETIDSLTIMELNDLVTELEEKYGVTAAAAVVAGPGAAAEVEEQTEFTVTLTDFGASKIGVIKVIREITGLGLKEAKAVVDEVPSVIKEDIEKEEADEIVAKLEEAGAKVEVK